MLKVMCSLCEVAERSPVDREDLEKLSHGIKLQPIHPFSQACTTLKTLSGPKSRRIQDGMQGRWIVEYLKVEVSLTHSPSQSHWELWFTRSSRKVSWDPPWVTKMCDEKWSLCPETPVGTPRQKPKSVTRSELSAVGEKWEVEKNTPKCTRLTVSLPHDPARPCLPSRTQINLRPV